MNRIRVMTSTYDLRKYRKIAFGTGLTSIFGCLLYDYYRLKRTLNLIVRTNVLETGCKRPDYIYIKYSVYRETMDQMRQQENTKNLIRIFVQPFDKWWKTFKHSVAWRLLEVAQSNDHYARLKAVHQLSRIDHLKDWDYQHLAQICDARTAISLARNNCDLRWFIPPRLSGAVRQPKSLIYEIQTQLDLLKPSKCVNHFYSTTFNKFNILNGYTYSDEYKPRDSCNVTKQEFEFLKQCLDVLFHITKDREAVSVMVDGGLLQTLIEIQKIFLHNIEIRFLLSKVMANISMCHELCNDFFVTGWVGVLASWSRNPDLRVQVTAAKALANMDSDDTNKFEYYPRIYPLYPKARIRQKGDVDIVFVHGLLGGVFVTWRQKDREEPKELGIYGKNKQNNSKDDDNIFLIDEFDKIYDKRNNCRHQNSNNKNVTSKLDENDTILYDESELVGKKSTKEKRTLLSNIATNELIATLSTANEISPEWEVVFPDCPTHADVTSNGPFSISGDKWINDDRNDEYTYCWPMDWLPCDYPNVRVIGLNYETSLSEWSSSKANVCVCEKKGTLHNRSEELLESLVAAGVGRDRPIIWVGHSMGGLIAKSIIVQALSSDDPDTQLLAKNTRAILFLGTPHKGTPVAKLKQHSQLILSPTIEVKELEENGLYILTLHEKFLQFMESFKNDIEIVSVAEGRPTVLTAFKFPFRIVTEDSAKLKFGDFYVLNVDHLGLSKPIFRQSFLYQRLLQLIDDVLARRAIEQQDENDKRTKNEEPFIDDSELFLYLL